MRGFKVYSVFLAVLFLHLDALAKPGEAFFTTSDGVKIHYYTEGEHGTWVVLIHGYSDSAQRMFVGTGVMGALAKDHRVVALDNRNHGLSDKPQPNGPGRAEDVIELMDHLKIQKAHIHGYSMGGGITGRLMGSNPDRFITAAFGGSGIGETDEALGKQAAALDPQMPEPQGAEAAAFRMLRERSARAREQGAPAAQAGQAAPQAGQGDAVGQAAPSGQGGTAAVGAGPRRTPLQIDLSTIQFPVLAINGEYDRPHSKTQRLWRELHNFQSVILAKKNHISAIGVGSPMPPEYIAALTGFIAAHDDGK